MLLLEMIAMVASAIKVVNLTAHVTKEKHVSLLT